MGINSITNSLIADIADIAERPKDDDYSSEFIYEARIHTKDKNLGNSEGVILSSVLIHRDYVNFISDYMEVTFSCMLGTFIHDIYEFVSNLEVTLYKVRQLKPGKKEVVIKERFKAVYLLERNYNIPTNNTADRDTLNQGLPVALVLQLVNRSAEVIRIKKIQGSFGSDVTKNPDMKVGGFLKSLTSTTLDELKVEGKKAIDKLDIEEVSNKGSLRSITIPTGTLLVDLVDYLQFRSDGVYNAGTGIYIQPYSTKLDTNDKVYFIYSLYDSNKYHKALRKAIFYSPPTSSLTMHEVTYKNEDGILRAIVASTNKLDDAKEAILISEGGGFSMGVDASSVMNRPVDVSDAGPVYLEETYNVNMIYKEREDGVDFAPDRDTANNIFVNASELMAKTGIYVVLKATNLDVDFFYPGMPCKIVFEDKKGERSELLGVIHKISAMLEHPNFNLAHSFNSSRIKLNSSMEIVIYVTQTG